jgi:hypothetical protein
MFSLVRMNTESAPSPWSISWNRIWSTDGATVKDEQNVGMFGYTQIPGKFENPQAQRNALGLVGGNEVSVIRGSLVDLESDLTWRTRALSKAIPRQYQPACPLGGSGCPDYPANYTFQDKSTGVKTTVDYSPSHLPTGQFTTYPGVPTPKTLVVQTAYPNRF